MTLQIDTLMELYHVFATERTSGVVTQMYVESDILEVTETGIHALNVMFW